MTVNLNNPFESGGGWNDCTYYHREGTQSELLIDPRDIGTSVNLHKAQSLFLHLCKFAHSSLYKGKEPKSNIRVTFFFFG